MTTEQNEAQGGFGWRSEAYAWSVVVLLIIAFGFAMVDRMILTLLVGPLKADLGLSDTQISLLHGLAFTMLYVVVGLPMGVLVDRYSRRAIAGISIATWSIMTVFCGLSGNFFQLFLTRMGVGIGEAGISPAANSLIADYFPASRLSLPITLYSLGGSAGVGMALIFGGQIVDYVSGLGPIDVPSIGEIFAWQASFLIAGLPGLIVAAAFFLVKEPPRQGRQNSGADISIPVSQTFRLVKDKASFLAPHFLASATCALVVLSIHSWMPTMLIREYGVSAGEAGNYYGLAVLIGGISGLFASGWLANRLASKGRKDSHIFVALLCTLFALLPAIFAPFAGNIILTVVLAGCAVFGLGAAIALAPVALPSVIPNEMRGQVYALYLLTLSILGYAVGPVIVALITDNFFQDEAMLGSSMAIVAAVGTPIAALFWIISRRNFLKING